MFVICIWLVTLRYLMDLVSLVSKTLNDQSQSEFQFVTGYGRYRLRIEGF